MKLNPSKVAQESSCATLRLRKAILITVHTTLQATITIAVPADVILQKFRQIEDWNQWYPDVLSASWQDGAPWTPGAKICLQVKNSLGRTMSSIATVQPAAPNVLSWENRMPGLVTLCHARVAASEGGTRFTLDKSYQGMATFLLQLLKGRQERMLTQGLQNLAQLVLAQQSALS